MFMGYPRHPMFVGCWSDRDRVRMIGGKDSMGIIVLRSPGCAFSCSPRGRASAAAVARDMTDRSNAVKRATIIDGEPGDLELRAGVTLVVRALCVSW